MGAHVEAKRTQSSPKKRLAGRGGGIWQGALHLTRSRTAKQLMGSHIENLDSIFVVPLANDWHSVEIEQGTAGDTGLNSSCSLLPF